MRPSGCELGGDLASSLFGAMPIEQARPVRRRSALDLARDVRARPVDPGDVEIRLVDAAILHQRRDSLHHRLERRRVAVILREVDRQKNGRRTKLERGAQRHAGAHAERARFVGRRGDDAASRRVAAPADDDRLALQVGTPQQLDRREERVHVEVKDARGETRAALSSPGENPRRGSYLSHHRP
jgi:hypothetical protein